MPIYASHTTNIPDGETIVLSAGKLKVNLDEQSLQYVVADTNVQAFNCPIGGVIAWFKSITGIPALMNNFVQCDGQTLSDADSPIDGEVIPNLNGDNRFLKGNSTSGTGSSGTHNHQWIKAGGGASRVDFANGSISATFNSAGNTIDTAGGTTLYTDKVAAQPPSMTVVWIMRVK